MQDFARALNLAVSFSPEQPQRLFRELVTKPFKEQIMSKDDAFFISYDFQPVAQSNSFVDLDIIAKIRSVWDHMAPQDKDHIWKYLQVLVLIDERC